MRAVLHAVLLAILCSASYTNASDIVLPADQDLQARRINEVCSALAPSSQPSYAEAHAAFKRRLGDYYSRYQNALYEGWKRSTSAEQYKKLRALADKMAEDGIEELKKNPDLAKQRCREAIATLADPRAEARFKDRVHKLEAQIKDLEAEAELRKLRSQGK
jgi:hypothetical protein